MGLKNLPGTEKASVTLAKEPTSSIQVITSLKSQPHVVVEKTNAKVRKRLKPFYGFLTPMTWKRFCFRGSRLTEYEILIEKKRTNFD